MATRSFQSNGNTPVSNLLRLQGSRSNVAFFGKPGSFTDGAAASLGSNAKLLSCDSINEVFSKVKRGALYGVVPAENTTEGEVNQTQDLLIGSPKVTIVGEVVMQITHSLIAMPGVRMDQIKTVFSHKQALAQCSSFIRKHGFNAVEVPNGQSTSAGVMIIKNERREDTAGIGSRRAAEVFGMNVLADKIETVKGNNFTRFFVITERGDQPGPTGRDKTTIVFGLKNTAGALVKAIIPISIEFGLNMTDISKRSIVGKPWHYIFLADFEGHRSDPVVKKALARAEKATSFLRVLGSYPAGGST
jgi:prephenate dehydratase